MANIPSGDGPNSRMAQGEGTREAEVTPEAVKDLPTEVKREIAHEAVRDLPLQDKREVANTVLQTLPADATDVRSDVAKKALQSLPLKTSWTSPSPLCRDQTNE